MKTKMFFKILGIVIIYGNMVAFILTKDMYYFGISVLFMLSERLTPNNN